MGLFDRQKTNFDMALPYFTVGDTTTLLIIGLGNPGEKYTNNRHNIGFTTLDEYQNTHDFSGWNLKKDLASKISIGQIGSTRVILAKPITFMNNSGEAAQKIQQFYRVYNNDTVVVHDELDIKYGTIRSKKGGSSAGHNGIKSISKLLGENYGRLRIGIGPKEPTQIDSADFVLQNFTKTQMEKLPKIIKEVCCILDETTAGNLPEHTVSL